jgi:hypothetical protein
VNRGPTVFVSAYNIFIGGKKCCLPSKNIFYMCIHNLSQNCSKRKRISFGNEVFTKNVLCVYMAYSSWDAMRFASVFLHTFNIRKYNLYIRIFPKENVYSLEWKISARTNIFILIAPTGTNLVVVSCLVKKVKELWHSQSAIKYEVSVIKCRKNGMEGSNRSYIDSQLHLHVMVDMFIVWTVNVQASIIWGFRCLQTKKKNLKGCDFRLPRSVNKVFAVLGCYAALIGIQLAKFRDSLSVPSS